jgi:hypothetical protein
VQQQNKQFLKNYSLALPCRHPPRENHFATGSS